MAQIYAYRSFDQAGFDLSILYYGAIEAEFLNDSYTYNRGRVIEDLLLVTYELGGYGYAAGIGGTGFASDGYRITGGTVTVLAEAWSDGYDSQPLWEIDRINISLADLDRATTTRSTVDDQRLLAQAFAGNDVFRMSFENDRAFGMGGNDTLYGNGGNDILVGGVGHDALYGGNGHDRLIVDPGNDLIDGGAGLDWLVLQGQRGGRIDLSVTARQNTGHGQDIIRGIENIDGGAGQDILLGNWQANVIRGNGGNDYLAGRIGNDVLAGNLGHDRLDGGYGADRLLGGFGNDVLIGSMGADLLAGGAGADRFVFRSAAESRGAATDLITDFQRGSDRIDLSGIDADWGRSGNQAFDVVDRFDGTGGGQIVIQKVPHNNATRVLLDMDGDGRVDAMIRLTGQLNLTESDFIL